jgi:hypothetical protein
MGNVRVHSGSHYEYKLLEYLICVWDSQDDDSSCGVGVIWDFVTIHQLCAAENAPCGNQQGMTIQQVDWTT